jgi:exodeoxyribonuclease V alpha subunit
LFTKERAAFINSFIKDEKAQISDKEISSNDNHPLFQHIVELRYSHRFKGDQGIGRFSKAVIDNDQSTIINFINTRDKEVIIDTKYEDKIFSDFVKGYESYIKETDIQKALNKLNELRVLCATREGDYGLYESNRRIEFLLQQKKLIEKSLEFYEHRPIMITRNHYDLKLFNGDIGIIRKDGAGVLKAWFIDSENNLRSILPGFVAGSETVFAMTIHKSQGSEFEKVLVMLPGQADIAILTRELLYTGVTRAKKQVFIQGTKEVILATAERKVKRASGIKERFENDELG